MPFVKIKSNPIFIRLSDKDFPNISWPNGSKTKLPSAIEFIILLMTRPC